jgi:hypothetical protein
VQDALPTGAADGIDPTIHPRSAATNGILEMIQVASAERHDGGVVEVL